MAGRRPRAHCRLRPAGPAPWVRACHCSPSPIRRCPTATWRGTSRPARRSGTCPGVIRRRTWPAWPAGRGSRGWRSTPRCCGARCSGPHDAIADHLDDAATLAVATDRRPHRPGADRAGERGSPHRAPLAGAGPRGPAPCRALSRPQGRRSRRRATRCPAAAPRCGRKLGAWQRSSSASTAPRTPSPCSGGHTRRPRCATTAWWRCSCWGFVPPGDAGDGHTFDTGYGPGEAEAALAAAVAGSLDRSTDVDLRTVCEVPVRALRAAAAGADMLVVGARGVGVLPRAPAGLGERTVPPSRPRTAGDRPPRSGRHVGRRRAHRRRARRIAQRRTGPGLGGRRGPAPDPATWRSSTPGTPSTPCPARVPATRS